MAMQKTKRFLEWWGRTNAHIPGLEGWQCARVAAIAKRAFEQGYKHGLASIWSNPMTDALAKYVSERRERLDAATSVSPSAFQMGTASEIFLRCNADDEVKTLAVLEAAIAVSQRWHRSHQPEKLDAKIRDLDAALDALAGVTE